MDAFDFFPRQPNGPEDGHLLHRQHAAARLPQQAHRQTQGFCRPGSKREDLHSGLFFGFKLHVVFNHKHEIIALKLTPGNVAGTTPVLGLTKDLSGKLFGDKGYIGQKLAQELLRRGLVPMTRVALERELPAGRSSTKPCEANTSSPRQSSASSGIFRRSGCRNIAPSSTPSLTLPPRSSPTRSIPCPRDRSASSCRD